MLDLGHEVFVYSSLAELEQQMEDDVRSTILGVVLALFMLCFLAIVIEETFLGGRRRRKMEKRLRGERDADNANSRA